MCPMCYLRASLNPSGIHIAGGTTPHSASKTSTGPLQHLLRHEKPPLLLRSPVDRDLMEMGCGLMGPVLTGTCKTVNVEALA